MIGDVPGKFRIQCIRFSHAHVVPFELEAGSGCYRGRKWWIGGERFLIFRGVRHLKLLASSLSPGVAAALASALLFGAGTPLAKWLLGEMSPWMLAGLLYLGSGLGLFV